MSRGDFFTLERKKVTRYTDLPNSFAVNPTTGYLGVLTNEDSIKQAMKNLIMTNLGERFYSTKKGCKIKGSLFENPEVPGTLEVVRLQIINCIQAYEPRIPASNITILDDENGIRVNIVYMNETILSAPISFDLYIKRVR